MQMIFERVFRKSYPIVLFLSLIALLVPLTPMMPGTSIDASWALALNQAVAQGLAFGRQIIFTLGPYSCLYTKAYHPATAFMLYGGSLLLVFAYYFCLRLLLNRTSWQWISACLVMLLTMIYSRDALLLFYPLLYALVAVQLQPSLKTVVINAGLALLLLVKGTVLILSVSLFFLSLIYTYTRSDWEKTAFNLLTMILSLLLFWLLAHQSLASLPAYLFTSVQIAMDFSEAMALPGNGWEVIVYLLVSGCILSALLAQRGLALGERLYLALAFGLFLFFAYKAGFVRHSGHSLIPGSAILMAAVVLPCCLPSRLNALLLLSALACWAFILTHLLSFSPKTYLFASFSNLWQGVKMDLTEPYWRERDFNLIKDYYAGQINLPSLAGTADVYSYDQIYLISSGSHWNPRPVFQSYSVFSQKWAEANAAHLVNEEAPDSLLVKLDPLDNRFAAQEDGLSWPVMISNYRPVRLLNEFLLLRKQGAHQTSFETLASDTHQLSEEIALPSSQSRLFVAMDIKPTWLGKISNLLYKPAPLFIQLQLKDGSKLHFRLSANMAKAPFLLSPVIENTEEFIQLVHLNPEALERKQVASFRIVTTESGSWQWQKNYRISWMRMSDAP